MDRYIDIINSYYEYNNSEEIYTRNDKDINFNLQDEYNNLLIHYAIIFNQEEIIKLLLSYECNIDYIDIDGKTILYYPIKYGYNNILKIHIHDIFTIQL
jgi:ankyrin repeat protein